MRICTRLVIMDLTSFRCLCATPVDAEVLSGSMEPVLGLPMSDCITANDAGADALEANVIPDLKPAADANDLCISDMVTLQEPSPSCLCACITAWIFDTEHFAFAINRDAELK